MQRFITLEIAGCGICEKIKNYILLPKQEFEPLERIIIHVAYFTKTRSKYKYALIIISAYLYFDHNYD